MNPFRKIANIFHYELINLRTKKHISPELHLKELIKHYHINCIIDVGAQYGHYGSMLRKNGYNGRIASFEPVKQTYMKLKNTNSGDKDWLCYNMALGSLDEQKEINVLSGSDLSSFYLPNVYADKVLENRAIKTGVESVIVKRLDTIFPNIISGLDFPRVLLKIDTQGHDLNVMEGALGCIDSIYCVQSEFAVKKIYDEIPDYIDSFLYFRKAGYEVTGMYPVSRDFDSMEIIEFDCFMVRCKQ